MQSRRPNKGASGIFGSRDTDRKRRLPPQEDTRMEGQTVGTDRRARTGGAFGDLRPPKPPEVPHSPPKLREDIKNLGRVGA